MKKGISVILISLSISFFAIGLHAADDAHNHAHSKHSGAAASALTLNNGDRWEMDDHTRDLSSKMQKTFSGADHSTQASLNALGVKLGAQLDDLIKGCTMDGEAHAQLHVFLTDYIPAVKNLTTAKDYDTARSSAIKLKGDLDTYKKHFK